MCNGESSLRHGADDRGCVGAPSLSPSPVLPVELPQQDYLELGRREMEGMPLTPCLRELGFQSLCIPVVSACCA